VEQERGGEGVQMKDDVKDRQILLLKGEVEAWKRRCHQLESDLYKSRELTILMKRFVRGAMEVDDDGRVITP
jgi:hypothetical protein